jgi:hypothetical protein
VSVAASPGHRAVSEDMAVVLQQVVCPAGLNSVALAQRLGDLEVLTGLACVQLRLGDGGDAIAADQATAVVGVIKDAVDRLDEGPSRRAVTLLLGIGHTRGLLRPARRRAAAEELSIGEAHFATAPGCISIPAVATMG